MVLAGMAHDGSKRKRRHSQRRVVLGYPGLTVFGQLTYQAPTCPI